LVSKSCAAAGASESSRRPKPRSPAKRNFIKG
jgi:hypothetical protein